MRVRIMEFKTFRKTESQELLRLVHVKVKVDTKSKIQSE